MERKHYMELVSRAKELVKELLPHAQYSEDHEANDLWNILEELEQWPFDKVEMHAKAGHFINQGTERSEAGTAASQEKPSRSGEPSESKDFVSKVRYWWAYVRPYLAEEPSTDAVAFAQWLDMNCEPLPPNTPVQQQEQGGGCNCLLNQPVDIPGRGNIYRLSIGKDEETHAAEDDYDEPPTWKELADAAIEFCKEEGICLSYLAEQGGIRRGGREYSRYQWPDEVKSYIASQLSPTTPPVQQQEQEYVLRIIDTDKWYWCKCESCGWEDSSEYCHGGGPIADTGDYFDPTCPVCGSTRLNGDPVCEVGEYGGVVEVKIPLDVFLKPYQKVVQRMQEPEYVVPPPVQQGEFWEGFDYALSLLDETYAKDHPHPYNIADCIKAKANRLDKESIRPTTPPVLKEQQQGGVQLIAAERQRQIEKEGWDSAHDSEHDHDELAMAAVCYALPPRHRGLSVIKKYWPWDAKWWKSSPSDRIKELVKAGALIAAEIDRLLPQGGNVQASVATGDATENGTGTVPAKDDTVACKRQIPDVPPGDRINLNDNL